MKILITGGCGFIGSHISRLLLEKGHQVAIYDNLNKKVEKEGKVSKGVTNSVIPDLIGDPVLDSLFQGNDKNFKFILGDIRDKKLLVKSLKGIDAVIHMASFIEVGESVKDPEKFAENNILGSVTLLEAMREAGVKKIVFSSSACVYGTPENLPIKETSPLFSANPYGASKVAIEAFMQVYHYLYSFDTIILRYFNPYGPQEHHLPETHAIPNFIKAALKKEPIPLYWKGEQVRDFIYVEDLAQAHIAPLNLKGYHIFNVGTEKGVKVIDVVNTIFDIVYGKGNLPAGRQVKDLGERPGDVPATYASSEKLHKATGWKAKVGLEEGLRRTVEWFSNHANTRE